MHTINEKHSCIGSLLGDTLQSKACNEAGIRMWIMVYVLNLTREVFQNCR